MPSLCRRPPAMNCDSDHLLSGNEFVAALGTQTGDAIPRWLRRFVRLHIIDSRCQIWPFWTSGPPPPPEAQLRRSWKSDTSRFVPRHFLKQAAPAESDSSVTARQLAASRRRKATSDRHQLRQADPSDCASTSKARCRTEQIKASKSS
jgi:hypothetical protein